MAISPLDLFDPAFLEGLSALPIEEIRARRDRASEVEVGLSYVRRLVQGRLDIVLHEARRRELGEQPEDLSDLVDRLPEILGEHVHGPRGSRLPTLMAPAVIDQHSIERLDLIVNAEQLAGLADLSRTELRAVAGSLTSFEREISADRRSIHDVIDRLQEELVRRYKTGEATVDSFFS